MGWFYWAREYASQEERNRDVEAAVTYDRCPFVAHERERFVDWRGKEGHIGLSNDDRAHLESCEKGQKQKLDKEYDMLCSFYGDKIAKLKDAVQPHTNEGGDAYYIGDAYRPINPVFAKEWQVKTPGPYLEYVKELGKDSLHLEYLSHWMQVTCAPPKWKFFRHDRNDESRSERAIRTKVCVIDYSNGSLDTCHEYRNSKDLIRALEADTQTAESRQTRLIIVEDLSRDLVERLGAYYDVDPFFFESHISDYLFSNPRDRWAEMPLLDVDARQMSHFHLSYLRARYFEKEKDFKDAEYESGMWNILRRLDSDRYRKRMQDLLDLKGASVSLSRAKTSLWAKPRRSGDPVTAILLIDPTVSTGHPLWGGYGSFQSPPSMKDYQNLKDGQRFDAPAKTNLFDDIVYWSSRMSSQDLVLIHEDPRYIALPMYKLVLVDWHTVLYYMTSVLGRMEWGFQRPHWGGRPQEIDDLLKKISPWRRSVPYYQTMIEKAIARLFPDQSAAKFAAPAGNSGHEPATGLLHSFKANRTVTGVQCLLNDFYDVKRQMDAMLVRIKNIESTATNAISIEETRRNKTASRLLFLATIFIPLNFTTSLLSISTDFTNAHESIKLFFIIGLPLTLIALVSVDLSHPTEDGFLMRKLRKLQGKPERKADFAPRHAKKKKRQGTSYAHIKTDSSDGATGSKVPKDHVKSTHRSIWKYVGVLRESNKHST